LLAQCQKNKTSIEQIRIDLWSEKPACAGVAPSLRGFGVTRRLCRQAAAVFPASERRSLLRRFFAAWQSFLYAGGEIGHIQRPPPGA
jgi:hypothetical protein